MTDFHAHILPAVDDGAKNLDESLTLLRMLSEQGVDTVIATPHFYANKESVDSFLARRADAFALLSDNLFDGAPNIILGAEVAYYSGISRLDGLSKLCVDGYPLLLLEMYMAKWSEYNIRELCELAANAPFTVVIAHIDRYMRFQPKGTIERLLNAGILLQANASFFYSFASKRKARSMLKKRQLHFIGSDCHNSSSRPPTISAAMRGCAVLENFVFDVTDF